MGKQRRQRQKLHISASDTKKANATPDPEIQMNTALPLVVPTEDVFQGLNIDFNNLHTTIDDTASVKSLKPTKFVSKRDKLKLRRDILLKKIDAVTQMKKDYRARNKRKKTVIMGDTNPLHDALPSLESLLKSSESKQKLRPPPKSKAIQKAAKRKKSLIKDVGLFKKILADKRFKVNPMNAISKHVKAVVNNEKVIISKV